jgi:hypothetical protein
VDARTASGDRTTIELELRHDGGTGTRLSLRGGADVRGADGHLLYEAVIASPAAIGEANDVQLSLALTFEASAAPDAPLDCRVRDADGTAPATDRLPLNPIADSRPRRFDARLTVDTLPRAWHLLCFGSALPADFALQNARLELRRQREHGQALALAPALTVDVSDPRVFAFSVDGPYLPKRLTARASTANLVATLLLESRASPLDAWMRHGRAVLASLQAAEPGPATFELGGAPRHRHWRLVTDPALAQPPDVTFEVHAEELLFLAQGEPPWQLHAGSYGARPASASQALITETVRRLGPAWSLPVVQPGERHSVAGDAALQPPAAVIPWQRYLLWALLAGGALVVLSMALRLLRSAEN